jgi:hypothetical protein
MKFPFKSTGSIFFAAGLLLTGCAKKHVSLWESLSNPDDIQQLKSFVAEKQAQANLATNAPYPGFASFFAAAGRGDWLAVESQDKEMRQQSVRSYTEPYWHGSRWEVTKEVSGVFGAFGQGNEKYLDLFGSEIIESIPPGSIYFGGTDPGRFVITAMQKSQVNGDPFFTLTQNALADNGYLEYLREIYGNRIYIPTTEDLKRCFDDYYADVQRRRQSNQLKPGEDVSVDPHTGRMQVSGQVAVMEINALIFKIIFDKEPSREFYVEESFPLDWMYPYLEPHGLIFKLNHKPLAKLFDETVTKDRDYWTKMVTPMIGNWLDDDTSVKGIAAFAEKVYLHHDFSNFTGDTNFVLNDYSYRTFSKARNASAGLYAWHANHTDDATEKERMDKEADFAFRQAWAMCPYMPEAVFRYVQLLMDEDRYPDALLVAETASEFNSYPGADPASLNDLVANLKRYLGTK